MNPTTISSEYITSFEEIFWGGLLVAVTMAIHGFGMVLVLHTHGALKERVGRRPTLGSGLGLLVLSSWMILLTHLLEVLIWAGFFLWKDAVNPNAAGSANSSLCYYFALLDYTCLGSNYNLRLNWRLLEGMISMAGLLTFAWSTGVLMTLAQSFQDEQLEILKKKPGKGNPKPGSAPHS